VPPKVRKAVIPAAGLGTRFLPATKATPKEMLPVVDKPAIQYVVEEAVGAGIEDILIITSRSKGSIEDHFDRSPELELELSRKGKDAELAEVRALAELADIHFVRQHEPLGLGHAVSVARSHVGDEPFAVMLGDDFMDGPDLLASMIDAHLRLEATVLALLEVDGPEISLYGAAGYSAGPEDGVVRVESLVEKPPFEEAGTNLAVIGRYVFPPSIFEALERVEPGKGGELQLTDAIALLLPNEPVYGRVFSTGRFDTGNKLDYLKATVELALRRPDLGEPFRAWLDEHLRG
jgi:UTP--glucose-1-phosphate uridylyltransferase